MRTLTYEMEQFLCVYRENSRIEAVEEIQIARELMPEDEAEMRRLMEDTTAVLLGMTDEEYAQTVAKLSPDYEEEDSGQ